MVEGCGIWRGIFAVLRAGADINNAPPAHLLAIGRAAVLVSSLVHCGVMKYQALGNASSPLN